MTFLVYAFIGAGVCLGLIGLAKEKRGKKTAEEILQDKFKE